MIRCRIELLSLIVYVHVLPIAISIADVYPQSRTTPLLVNRALAILHPRNPGRLDLLVLTLVVGDHGAQVGLGTRGDIVWHAGVHHAAKESQYHLSPVAKPHHILGLPQLVRLAGSLRLEQVAVGSGLLQKGSVDGVALLKVFLRRSVLADEAGDPRLRAGFLVRLAEAVEDVGGGKAANGDVEAALLIGCHTLATNCIGLKVAGSLSSSRPTSEGRSLRRGLRSPALSERSGSRNGEGAAARRAAVPKQKIV